MTRRDVSAEVISRPGGLGDASYPALEIRLKGFESPYALTLALPAIVYRALSEQMDPLTLYDAIARAVNGTRAAVDAGHDGVLRGEVLIRRVVADAATQGSPTKV